MKKTCLSVFLVLFGLNAHAGMSEVPKKEKVDTSNIEVFDSKPTRPHTMVSPISADKNNTEAAFEALKVKAVKMGASAIYNWSCQAAQEVKTGLLRIRTANTDSVCQGVAIKWK